MGKSALITVVGKTQNGKLVIDGVWKCFETFGLPFDVIFEVCIRKGWIPEWTTLRDQMVRSGIDKGRVLVKLSEAISDTFGKDFCEEVLRRLS
jgi:alanyl-tRNA synthetase